MYKLLIGFLFLITFNIASAQELNAKVTVNANAIGSNVNKNVFQTLEAALNTFINNRKWTTDNFQTNEKIDCNFLLTLQPTSDANVYTATLTVQAGRPVFNSSYLSPIVNFQDKDFEFKYVEFQKIEFNENNVSGADALAS